MATRWNYIVVVIALMFCFAVYKVSSAELDEVDNQLNINQRTERAVRKKGKAVKFAFDEILYKSTIRDTTKVGTSVLVVSASFKKEKSDRLKKLNYRIKERSLRRSPKDVFPFKVTKVSGEVILVGPISNDTGSFQFKIEAYVYGNKKVSAKTNVLITIDRTPITFSFSSKSFLGYIEENIYGDVNVTLELLGVEQNGASPPSFEIIEILPEFFPSRFGIDQNGMIFVRYPLDREDVAQYYVTVGAEQDGAFDQTMVIVHVTDQNDNPPYFLYDQLRMTVFENVNLTYAGNTFVKAYDDDYGVNAEIRYEILSGSLGMIYIDSKTGHLYNSIDLDYEKLKRLKLIIAAYSGELRATCKVFIYIRDMNDNPPVVNDFEIFYNGLPNTIGGAEVAKIPVSDPDTTGILRFGILVDEEYRGSLDQGLIEVDSTSGMIRISPRIENTEEIDVVADFGIYVFDGLHAASARCRITMTGITDQMVENSVSAHVLNMTEEQFLQNDGLKFLRNATKEILGAASVKIFDIEEFVVNKTYFVNVSFCAKKLNGDFFTPMEVLNAIYFQKDMMETMCGFNISPAEEDNCVAETCNKRQRCVTRKALKSTRNTYETQLGDISIGFFGVPLIVEHWCECLETKRDGNCSRVDPCESSPCRNKGMCYENEDGNGYGCICPKGFIGSNCESKVGKQRCFPGACGSDEECENLPTGSFHCVCKRTSGCPNEHTWYFPKGAYLAFPNYRRKSTMKISLQFSTYRDSGLLLYLGRYSFMYDFLALEIINSEISLTFNVGKFIMRVKVGAPGGVNDGKWHMVELKYHEKVVQVILDECKEEVYANSDYICAAYATQALDVTTWFLDVNTPFILGSLPIQDGDSRIINNDFKGCIKDIHINNRLYSAGDTIRTKDTEQGCPWYKQRPDLQINDDTFL